MGIWRKKYLIAIKFTAKNLNCTKNVLHFLKQNVEQLEQFMIIVIGNIYKT